MTGSDLASFYVPWSAALAASTAEPIAVGAPLLIAVGDVQLPVVQAALAIAGVLLARPLAPRSAAEQGWLRQISVTLIMAIVAVAWVIESRPGVLFTFVVAIGLGFSGHALIASIGQQIEGVAKRALRSMTAALNSFGSSSGDKPQ